MTGDWWLAFPSPFDFPPWDLQILAIPRSVHTYYSQHYILTYWSIVS